MKLPLPKPSMPARLAAGLQTMVIALALSPMLPAAAGAQSSKLYETVREATLKPGMAIPEPSGPVILTVDGKIRSGKPVRFDLATLESLGLIRFTTPTNWTAQPSTFEGVPLSALLDAVGADPKATTLNLTALNDFESPAPIVDARKWLVMLALKRDGEYMSRRERGPVWVIYPQHAYPELGQREYLSRWVWQLKAITVQ